MRKNLGEAAKWKLTLWWRLMDMKRDPFSDYKSFLNSFDLSVVELEATDVKIDPTIKAGMLIKAIHLPEEKRKLVLSSIDQKARDIYAEVRKTIESIIMNQFSESKSTNEATVKAMYTEQEKEQYKQEIWRQAHVLAAQSSSNWYQSPCLHSLCLCQHSQPSKPTKKVGQDSQTI